MYFEQANEENIISMKNWVEKKEESKELQSYTDFLNVLTFNQLIEESHSTAEELKNSPLNLSLTSKSKLILKEFNKRLNFSRID